MGDTVRALIDTPGNTQANWAIAQNNIGYVPLNAASNLSDLTNASTARSNLGVAIGTNVQAYHDNLQYFSGLTATGDGLPYFSSGSAMSLSTFTAFARTLLDDVDAATMRTTLGVTIGTNVQAWDTDLDTIAGLSASNDDIIQRKAGAWASRTPAQVATDLQGTGLTVDMVGFRGIPQNSQSAAYTTVAADAGKHIHHPSTDANARTFTIDSNANVAYPIGTAITFTNRTSQVVTIAITSDTMYLAGTTTTGSRSLAENGIATALKVNTTTWIISGAGLT